MRSSRACRSTHWLLSDTVCPVQKLLALTAAERESLLASIRRLQRLVDDGGRSC